MERVLLEVAGGDQPCRWEAPVWFCEPRTPAFGRLGLTGFFDQFDILISAYEERFELHPR
jgi:hypothetical protein